MDATISDDGSWRIGTDAEIRWIAEGTPAGLTITSAIPPVFDRYATIVVPEDNHAAREAQDRALVSVLRDESANQRWWLGYLDTGADDIVFPEAPRVTLYADWPYVLVEAGPEQALTWPLTLAEADLASTPYSARPDFSDRPPLAGVAAVGRRLDLCRRVCRTGTQASSTFRPQDTPSGARAGRHSSRPHRHVATDSGSGLARAGPECPFS